MKLGKIFICINILVLSLLMLTGCTEKWPRIIYQNTSYRFDEYNRTIVLDDGHSYEFYCRVANYFEKLRIITHQVMYEFATASLNLIQRLSICPCLREH